ncbi:unnamed protein product, partial [Lampetra fluviatilis]
MRPGTDEVRLTPASPGRGVSAIAVDPSHSYLAVAESGMEPRVVIYKVASLQPHRCLTGGAVREFTCLAFAPPGRVDGGDDDDDVDDDDDDDGGVGGGVDGGGVVVGGVDGGGVDGGGVDGGGVDGGAVDGGGVDGGAVDGGGVDGGAVDGGGVDGGVVDGGGVDGSGVGGGGVGGGGVDGGVVEGGSAGSGGTGGSGGGVGTGTGGGGGASGGGGGGASGSGGGGGGASGSGGGGANGTGGGGGASGGGGGASGSGGGGASGSGASGSGGASGGGGANGTGGGASGGGASGSGGGGGGGAVRLFASVSGLPDLTLTVWDWRKQLPLLRAPSHGLGTRSVRFHAEWAHRLTTAGPAHIKFWTLARTFTGLKLQGIVGRFGKRPQMEVEAFVDLPDGKVVSGTADGCLLLWEGACLRAVVTRVGGAPCHVGAVTSLALHEGELLSASADGTVAVWDVEALEAAESHEGAGEGGHSLTHVELEPLNQLRLGARASLLGLIKGAPQRRGQQGGQQGWYAQDESGGIWKLDLAFSNKTQEPVKVFGSHGGAVSGLGVSPRHHLAASTAQDGRVRVYDTTCGALLAESLFPQAGTSLAWAPTSVDPSGLLLCVGFSDGVVRLLRLEGGGAPPAPPSHGPSPTRPPHWGARPPTGSRLMLVWASKPHTERVNAVAFHSTLGLLCSG